MKKVAVFFAEGFEEIEALTVVDLLRRAKITTDMVSITGTKQVCSSHKVRVEMDRLFHEINADEYDMMVLPGGLPGTTNLEACEPLMQMLDDFYEKGKMIGAICAAPSIFGHRGYLKGRRACCYPGYEKDLLEAEVVYEEAVKSDHVITSRGMGCSCAFGLKIIETLLSKEERDALEKRIIYKASEI